ncbi:MAG: GreA/GreB family elongation factor [bacterium]|nr:GreA/GreB family elongation factor [Candidatus Wildermuthbacteria bacterium]MDP2664879.1 GreA/GreB family elongation factor [bacterium]
MGETKFQLTKEGLKRIKNEYEGLLKLRNTKAKSDVPSIWHSEDVNPEYLSYQEDMTLLESRIGEYEATLKNAKLITVPPKEKRKTVFPGAKVTVVIDDGLVDEYQIVGTLEANPSLGKISVESPVGRALLGLKIGDVVAVSSPKKTMFRVKKVQYS